MLNVGPLRLIYVGSLRLSTGLADVQQGPPIAKPTRRPRADGERNRTRLIAAAKRACAEKGAAVSLEHIAREADVSIATLYRHFPTRDELISAVYQQEVDMLIEAADQLMTKREPATALREWLMLFVDDLGLDGTSTQRDANIQGRGQADCPHMRYPKRCQPSLRPRSRQQWTDETEYVTSDTSQ